MDTKCNAIPYEGEKSFVFIHFSKNDWGAAYTLAEILANKGYRIWYTLHDTFFADRGEEKAGVISGKIDSCTVLIALYSEAATNDHQFRKVITAAVFSRKTIIPVFLDKVQLSYGMHLQLGGIEEIDWCLTGTGPERLMNMLVMQDVKGEPDSGIQVIVRNAYKRNVDLKDSAFNRLPVSSIIENEDDYFQRRDGLLDSGVKNKGTAAEIVQLNNIGYRTDVCMRDKTLQQMTLIDETEYAGESNTKMNIAQCGHYATMIVDEANPVFVCLSTGIRYTGCYGITRIGRGEANHVCVPEKTVSVSHAEVTSFVQPDGSYKNTIRDCGSSNGTWIDGKRLDTGVCVTLGDCMTVGLSRKTYLYMAFGNRAEQLAKQSILISLEYCDTGVMHVIDTENVDLGRNDPWNNGFFEDPRISWEHAQLESGAFGCRITDRSSNGTYINGKRITKHKTVDLIDGDEIVMGCRKYRIHLIRLREQ